MSWLPDDDFANGPLVDGSRRTSTIVNGLDPTSEITALLEQAVHDEQARNLLYELVYAELQLSARRMLAKWQRDDLQTTALINEVVMRIERADCFDQFANRKVFFAVAAKAMRQVLIDHYRRRQRRVEGRSSREPLDAVIDQVEVQAEASFDALAEQLDRLEAESPRQHAVIMHRFFGGRTVGETAEMLGVSEDTVVRDWRLARAKLFKRLHRQS